MQVGSVEIKLIGRTERRAFDEYAASIDQARAKSAHDIQQRLGGKFDTTEFHLYYRELDKVRAQVARRKAFSVVLGADYNPKAMREFERDLARMENSTKRGHQNVKGLGLAFKVLGTITSTLPRQLRGISDSLIDIAKTAADAGAKLGGALANAMSKLLPVSAELAANFGSIIGAVGGFIGGLGGIVGVAGAVSAVLISLVGTLAALAGSLAAAAAGIGAVSAGFAAALGPLAALGVAVARRFSLIQDAYKAVTTAQDKSGVAATKNANTQRRAAGTHVAGVQRIKDAERALADARRSGAQSVKSAQQQLADTARSSADTIKKAEADVAAARESGARSVAQAARNLADVRTQGAKSVKDAESSLADAQKTARGAQADLTQARKDAVRELQDLKNAADHAALSQEGANLSLQEAYKRLRQVQADPKSSGLDIAEAQHAVKQAVQDVKDAQVATQRANEDQVRGTDTVRKAREALTAANEGVVAASQKVKEANVQAGRDIADALKAFRLAQADASDGITKAVEALTAAQVKGARDNARARQQVAKAETEAARATARAAEGITRAQQANKVATENATAAVAAQGGAADTAQQKLAKLSDTERHLLVDFRKFASSITSVFRPATDAIFQGFDGALTKITPLIGRYKGAFTDLGQQLGGIIQHAAARLSGPEWTSALDAFIATTRKIIRPLANALGSVIETFRNIAVAAQPFVVEFSRTLENAFGKLASKTSDVAKMRDIIGTLVDHTISWAKFMGAVARLFTTIFTGGAASGRGLVDALTHIVNRWNAFLQTDKGQKQMKDFFKDSIDLTKTLFAILAKVVDHFITLGRFFQDHRDTIGKIVKPIADTLTLIGKLIVKVPILGTAILALAAVNLGRTLGLGLLVSGLGKAIGLVKKLRTEAVITGAATGPIQNIFTPTGDRVVPSRANQAAGVPGAGTLEGGAAGGAASKAAGIGSRVLSVAAKVFIVGMAAEVVRQFTTRPDGTPSRGAGTERRTTTPTPDTQKLSTALNAASIETGSKALERLSAAFDAAVKSGNKSKLGPIADGIETIGKRLGGIDGKVLTSLAEDMRRISGSAHKHLADVAEVTDTVRSRFEQLRSRGGKSMADLESVVNNNTHDIRKKLGDTRQGTDAMANNFADARKAVRQSVHDSVITTEQGTREINRLLRKELKELGITNLRGSGPQTSAAAENARGQITGKGASGGRARDIAAGLRGGLTNANLAVGGWIGQQGMMGTDMIPALLGEGEAVLNRHQQGVIEGLLGNGFLDKLFSTVTTPHYLAKGGFAQKVQKFAGGGIAAGIAAANKLDRANFPYVWGGGHEQPARFEPMDCSGAVSYILQHAGVKIPTMTSGQLAGRGNPGPGAMTVWANPTHTFMALNGRHFASRGHFAGGGPHWIPDPGTAYKSRFAVRHFGGSDSFIPGFSDVIKQIKAPRVAQGGLLGAVVQGGLDNVAGAANARAAELVAQMGVGKGNIGDNMSVKGQPGVISGFRQAIAGARPKPTAKERLALWEAGIVESNLTNIPAGQGDRDSVGALQQRPSQGWHGLANPRAAALEFLQHAAHLRPFSGTAGNLAQAVQRSAFPARYDAVAGQARKYLSRGGFLQKFPGAIRASSGFLGRGSRPHARKRILPRGNPSGGNEARTVVNSLARRDTGLEAFDGSIQGLEREYSQMERGFSLKDQVLLIEQDDGSTVVDQGALQSRLNDIAALINKREAIKRKIIQYQHAVERLIQALKEAIGRLQRAIRAAAGKGRGKKKERDGYQKAIDEHKVRINELRGVYKTLVGDVVDQDLDLDELHKEYTEVASTHGTDAPVVPPDQGFTDTSTDTGGGTTDPNLDLQVALDRANKLAADTQANLTATQGNLAALLSPGDIGAGISGGNALGAVLANAGGGAMNVVGQAYPQGAVAPVGAGGNLALTIQTLAPFNQKQLQQVGDVVVDAFQTRTLAPVTSAKVG